MEEVIRTYVNESGVLCKETRESKIQTTEKEVFKK